MREKEAQSESERKTLTNLQEEMARISLSTEEKKNEIMQILSGRASTKARLQHFHTLREQLRVQKAELAKQLLAITVFSRKSPEKMNRSESDRALTTESSPGWNR